MADATPKRLPCRSFPMRPDDAERIDRIAAAYRARTGYRAAGSNAIRWALAELDARLALEEKAAGQPVLGPGGPMTQPPKPA